MFLSHRLSRTASQRFYATSKTAAPNTVAPQKAEPLPKNPPTKLRKKDLKSLKDSETVPKRAKSAWVYYIEAQSATVKTENPTAKGGETFKILSERWKKLSTEEKQPYLKLAAEDKERNLRETRLQNNPEVTE